MSLSIFDRGEGRFDLVYGDTEIGWVSDRAIGFNGFGDRAAARRGAAVAYDADQMAGTPAALRHAAAQRQHTAGAAYRRNRPINGR